MIKYYARDKYNGSQKYTPWRVQIPADSLKTLLDKYPSYRLVLISSSGDKTQWKRTWEKVLDS